MVSSAEPGIEALMAAFRPACNAPFIQMTLQPGGEVSPCCYLYGHHLGQLKNGNFDEIWNGQKLRKLRREFLSGSPKTCLKKMRHIGCHKQFRRFDKSAYYSEVQVSPPQRLDVRLNGQCNLRCVMCEVWQAPNGQYEGSDLWQRGPKEIFPFLKEIDLLGGEPMIQKDTYRLIKAVNEVNQICRWGFVTNGQYQFKGRVQGYLERICLRWLQISVDSLEAQTYERIRRGGSFARLSQTIDEVSTFHEDAARSSRSFTLCFSMCVLKSNWHEVPAFLKFCRDHGAKPDLQFAFYDPSQQASLNHLTVNEKQVVINYLEGHTNSADSMYLQPILSPLRSTLARHAAR